MKIKNGVAKFNNVEFQISIIKDSWSFKKEIFLEEKERRLILTFKGNWNNNFIEHYSKNKMHKMICKYFNIDEDLDINFCIDYIIEYPHVLRVSGRI